MSTDLLSWLDQLAAAQDHATAVAQREVRRTFSDVDWYSDGNVADKALEAATAVRDAELQVASSVDDFLAGVFDDLDLKPPDHDSVVDEFLRGDDPDANPVAVYARPAEQYRYARSRGVSHADAGKTALRRADEIVEMDVALAGRAAGRQNLLRVPQVTGYRRVIHPELSRHGVCGLCATASTRVYHVGELMPIHENCRCGVIPIVGSVDPGGGMNKASLGVLYEAAARDGRTGTSRDDLRRVRVSVDDHGELGPILVPAGRVHVPVRVRREPDRVRASAELVVLRSRLGVLERAVRTDPDARAPLAWVRERVKYLMSI